VVRRVLRGETRIAARRRHRRAGRDMMRVALVNPPAFAALTTLAQEAVPPLGLAYVAAAARAAGHDVTVVDAVGLGLERVTRFAPIPGTVLTGLDADDVA